MLSVKSSTVVRVVQAADLCSSGVNPLVVTLVRAALMAGLDWSTVELLLVRLAGLAEVTGTGQRWNSGGSPEL